MRSTIFLRYGPPDVLRVVDTGKPTPGRGEVLIKVYASTVTAAEMLMRRGRPLWGRLILGPFRPRRKLRTLGLEIAGDVEAVGPGVRRFRPGDRVYGFTGFGAGGCAEYKCMPETGSLAHAPATASYAQAAAAVDGATTALYFLRGKGRVQSGQKVLINGASGSIGTYAVQLAKLFGAEVTAVCGPRNADLVRSLGADRVIDHTREDFTSGDDRYDVVFDAVGRSSFRKSRRVLTPTGRYLPTTGLFNNVLMAVTGVTRGRRVVTGMSIRKREALEYVRELIDAGRLRVVIDRTYPLEDVVSAHRYVQTGHKAGNVVIAIWPS